MLLRPSAFRSVTNARFAKHAFPQSASKTAVRTQTRSYASATSDVPVNKGEFMLAIGVGALIGAGWYYYSKRIGDSAHSTPAIKTLDGTNFMKFKLREAEGISPNTKKFRFDLPSPHHILGLDVASAIVTRFAKPGTENSEKIEYVVRPYTPTSDEDARGYFDLIIKRYNNGPMSNHIHNLNPGDELEVKGPIPKYKYEKGELANIGMIAGGTGIAPMFQLLRKIFKDPTDNTKVRLLFANVAEEDILLRKELDQLQKDNPDQFHVVYTLDKPPKGWGGETGFVNEVMVKNHLPSPADEGVMIFVCGPAGMVAHVAGSKAKNYTQGEVGGILAKLGFKEDKVYKF